MVQWNEVTWYSKLGAIILFIGVVPALCFYIGTQYAETQQEVITPLPLQQNIASAPSSQQPAVSSTTAYVDATIEASLDNCLNSPDGYSNIGSLDCLGTALRSYEAVESVQYNLLEATMKENLQSLVSISPNDEIYYIDAENSLPKAEQSWKTYRDTLCSVDADSWTTGTESGDANASCEIALTKKHIKDLMDVRSHST
jgi:hypothetical protein